jgi:hypothetical protein
MQDSIVAEYGENCLSDMASCLTQNNYTSSPNVAVNACSKQIITCMSINGDVTETPNPSQMLDWVAGTMSNLGN